MKNMFKKISAIAASALMVGMTMGVAAATTYPAPFASATTAAIVYGTGAGVNPSDLVQATFIQTNLAGSIGSSGGTPSGDNVLLAEGSDNLNINNTWATFVGSVDDDDLSTLLADGTYIAGDNDEFTYEQKIDLGSPELTHFRDSDYESLAGLTERTPVVGFKISSNTYILNYTIDFLSDVTSDVDSNLRMEDIEGSDIPLLGKTYYVSEMANGTSTSSFGKTILLDSAEVGNVREGETATVAGKAVSIDWIDADEVVFMIDGVRAPASGKLVKGNSFKLDDGSYVGVRDITKLAVSGEIGGASFSIGTGKLELNHGQDIKLNDDTITGIKAHMWKTTTKLDKITIQWRTDEESFVSPMSDLVMPGFGAVKFSMNELVRAEEEKIVIEKDSDTSIELSMPLKDGTVSFNILYSNSSGEFSGIGKATDEKLATTNYSDLVFYEKRGGNDWHSYFVATYNTSKEGESYLLRAKISQDTTAGRNETTIQKYDGSGWVDVCTEKKATDTCSVGDVSLTIGVINYSSGGDESVNITAGTPSDNKNVNFHTALTPGGLMVYLPYDNNFTGVYGTALINNTARDSAYGAVSLISGPGNATFKGHGWDTVALFMLGEDKDENLGAGTLFNLTLNDNTDNKVYVSEVDNSGTGGGDGLEQGDTNVYEAYIKDAVAPRVLHYTNPDEDWAEVYYPGGDDSETYAEVFLTEEASVMEGGSAAGPVLVKDTEVSSVSSKNLIVVGGSCINSAAATLVGGAKCTSDWTAATGVGSGQFLIQSFGNAFTTGKVALLVAGYETADTVNAVTYLKTQTVDTTAGKKYKGTSATSASLVVA